MHFLPDVYVPCEQCDGKRYNRETLEHPVQEPHDRRRPRDAGRGGARVLRARAQDRRKLQALSDVGLGYIRLGQPATTLSGGEAQRVKLAAELSKVATGNTLYILDEPTTGLHFADIQRLLDVLQRLVDAGNTVVVIEHNLDVIKVADRVVDLGPGAATRAAVWSPPARQSRSRLPRARTPASSCARWSRRPRSGCAKRRNRSPPAA